MKEEKTFEENETKQTESKEQNHQLVLTIDDFVSMKNIMEVATKAGIVHPSEMLVVGTLYNKIDTLIRYMQAAQQMQKESKQTKEE